MGSEGRGADEGRRGGTALGIATALAAVPVGWMAYSALAIDHAVELPPAVDAERRTLASARAGTLSYYADEGGAGPPVLLLHSINAAASAYEVKPLFEMLRGRRPVYALELPGFGFSERADRHYTPALYADAIVDFLAAVPAGPCDVVALSLAGEFAGMAAARAPDRVRSLVLVSPTGFSRPTRRSAGQRRADGGGGGLVARVLGSDVVGQPLFDALVSRPSIRFFLSQSFAGPVDEGAVDYAWRTAHRPGARFAPLVFVSGRLFTPDACERIYAAVEAPALVLHDDAPYGDFAMLAELAARRPNWRGLRIGPTRGLPHFERPEATRQALDDFWRALG